ncbi:Uncharacterised protein [Bordetella pertussis]|nr:Uncharacterised protein [Bordetella pertussis]
MPGIHQDATLLVRHQQLSAAGLTLTNLSVDAVAAPGFALPEA